MYVYTLYNNVYTLEYGIYGIHGIYFHVNIIYSIFFVLYYTNNEVNFIIFYFKQL